MSHLDPQYNKTLAAYLSRTDMPTREAIKDALLNIRREHKDMLQRLEQHYSATTQAIQKLERRVAEHEAAVHQMMDVDPTTLTRAQITRLARKLNL